MKTFKEFLAESTENSTEHIKTIYQVDHVGMDKGRPTTYHKSAEEAYSHIKHHIERHEDGARVYAAPEWRHIPEESKAEHEIYNKKKVKEYTDTANQYKNAKPTEHHMDSTFWKYHQHGGTTHRGKAIEGNEHDIQIKPKYAAKWGESGSGMVHTKGSKEYSEAEKKNPKWGKLDIVHRYAYDGARGGNHHPINHSDVRNKIGE